MSYPFTYTRPTDRITAGSWTLPTGTARAGYPLANLDDLDPSNPLWLSGTSIALLRSFGVATRVDAVDIYAHTFASGCDLRVQMHTADSWASPDVNIAVSIPAPYEDGCTYHLRVNVAAAYSSAASRTKSYLRIVNGSANAVTVAIGEVCMWSQVRTLSRGIRYAFVQPRLRLTSGQPSKRGVWTTYDYGTNERPLQVSVPASDTDMDDLRALEASAHGDALPFSVLLAAGATKARFAEPMLVQLTAPISTAPYEHYRLSEMPISLRECGCGELVGA